MNLMIASDIHGSAACCRKLLERFDIEGADRLLLLGDILYHGPRNRLPEGYDPQKTAAMLNERKERIFSVRGNCDAEVDQMVLEFPVMAEFCLLYEGRRLIYAAHGHQDIGPGSVPALGNSGTVLFGHTHIPEKRREQGVWYLNPGSVSIPKADSQKGYMTLTGGSFYWKTLDGACYDCLETGMDFR